MTSKEEVAKAFRKLANDTLAVAIATDNDDALAVAMSLIEYKFSAMNAVRLMHSYSQEKIEGNNA